LDSGWTRIGGLGGDLADPNSWSPRTLLHVAAHVNWTNLTHAGAGSLILVLVFELDLKRGKQTTILRNPLVI